MDLLRFCILKDFFWYKAFLMQHKKTQLQYNILQFTSYIDYIVYNN